MSALAKIGRTRGARIAKWVFQALLLALVAAGIWHTIARAMGRIAAERFSLAELRPAWLVASGLIYLVSSVPMWWFWHRVLTAMGQRPTWYASLRAYYIGHLGKYVPGKAMVVVLRTALVRGPTVDTTVAATAVFVETLTSMAVGAVISSVILMVRFHDQTVLLTAALTFALVAGIPALPPVFRHVLRLLRVTRASQSLDAGLHGLNWPLMITGWIILAGSWCLMGLSLWAALMSLPNPPAGLTDVYANLPVLTLCVAMALVAGFVSLVPAGAGVREAVVITVLVPVYGDLAALVAAILLRLVWLLAEASISTILYVVRPAAPPPSR